MKEFRVSIAEYDFISQELSKSQSGIIIYNDHIFTDIGDDFLELIICTPREAFRSRHYEWMEVVTPFDIRIFPEV